MNVSNGLRPGRLRRVMFCLLVLPVSTWAVELEPMDEDFLEFLLEFEDSDAQAFEILLENGLQGSVFNARETYANPDEGSAEHAGKASQGIVTYEKTTKQKATPLNEVKVQP